MYGPDGFTAQPGYDIFGRPLPTGEGQIADYGDWHKNGDQYTNTRTGQQMNSIQYQSYISDSEKKRVADEDQAKKDAGLKAQGLNPDGSPIRPEYQTLIDPATGKLKSQYNLDLSTVDPNSLEGYNMLKNLATSKGPTDSAKYQMDKANMLKEDTIDQGTAQSESSQAAARSALAMRGGASSGSRERLAEQGQRDLLNNRQSAYRQNSGNILDILKSDEDIKRQALGQYSEAEGKLALSNNQTQNTAATANNSRLLQEEDLKRSNDFDTYKAALDKWAANKQAESASHAGGGGGK